MPGESGGRSRERRGRARTTMGEECVRAVIVAQEAEVGIEKRDSAPAIGAPCAHAFDGEERRRELRRLEGRALAVLEQRAIVGDGGHIAGGLLQGVRRTDEGPGDFQIRSERDALEIVTNRIRLVQAPVDGFELPRPSKPALDVPRAQGSQPHADEERAEEKREDPAVAPEELGQKPKPQDLEPHRPEPHEAQRDARGGEARSRRSLAHLGSTCRRLGAPLFFEARLGEQQRLPHPDDLVDQPTRPRQEEQGQSDDERVGHRGPVLPASRVVDHDTARDSASARGAARVSQQRRRDGRRADRVGRPAAATRRTHTTPSCSAVSPSGPGPPLGSYATPTMATSPASCQPEGVPRE